MKVGIHIQSANDEKFAVMLRNFADSISNYGDSVVVNELNYSARNYDVDVFFGSWKDRDTPWHICKRQIIANHQKTSRPFVVFETPILGRGPVADIMQDKQYRVGINGFLADDGFTHISNSPYDRLHQSDFSIPTRNASEDGYILVALQLPGDASLRGCDISVWAKEAVLAIKQYSDRPILLRTPQLERDYDLSWLPSDVTLQKGSKDNLNNSLDNAWCTVTYSSGLAIDSMLRGIPAIACHSASFAYGICDHNFVDVNQPFWPDVELLTQWLADLAYAQWTEDEIANSSCWKYIRHQLAI